MKALFPFVFALAAGGASAQDVAFVAGPAGCAFLDGFDESGARFTVDEDHLVLTGAELVGIEWYCGFEPAFDPFLESGEIETRIGYCMEPGPIMDPGVFTLLERGDGTVQLDSSQWDEPLILAICAGH